MLEKRTDSAKWKRTINSIINAFEAAERKIGNANFKLGVIPLK